MQYRYEKFIETCHLQGPTELNWRKKLSINSDNTVQGLTSKKFVDKHSGDAYFKYYWKRNLVPKVEIKGDLPDKLSGYCLIQKDLKNVLSWMSLAEELSPNQKGRQGNFFNGGDRKVFDQIKALFVASLTFYGKCYTAASGRHAQISRDWLDEEHKKLHDYYMNYRHNFAAHSGNEKLELARTFVLTHPKKNELLPYLPTVRTQPDVILPSEGGKGLKDLVEYALKILDAKHSKLVDKIVNELILPKGPDFWKKAAKSGKPVQLEISKKRMS